MAAITVLRSQAAFYREFLMGRSAFNPQEFGVNMEKDEFMDLMVQEFNKAYGHMLSFDELLLRPQWSLKFCDSVRTAHGFLDVPDDIILRSVMTRRKNP